MNYSPQETAQVAEGVAMVVFLVFAVVALAVLILGIIIWWKIFSKAGYPGALGLLMFVPIANLVMILILAFGQWPIHRELEQLRRMQSIPRA